MDYFLKTAEIPTIQYVISNTTEAGIQFSPQDQFEEIAPNEFPAKLTRWLFARWQYFGSSSESGCVFLPCELIENNGVELKKCILQYANLWKLSEDFKQWVNQYNYFCNTLVDRIVTGFPKNNIEGIYADLGFEDKLIVKAEPYHSWVIEAPERVLSTIPFLLSNFNVTFTHDLNIHRQLKVRILNGAHIAMVPIGYLSGIETVRESVENEVLGRFIQDLLQKEILPTLDYPKPSLKKYTNTILDRFKNPFIRHQLIDISLNAIPKFKVRVLPSLLIYTAQKQQIPKRICFAFATLIFFYKGERAGETVPLKATPEVITFFHELWQSEPSSMNQVQDMVEKVLSHKNFWEQNLTKVGGLKNAVSNYLWDIHRIGVLKSLAKNFPIL